MIHHLRHSEIDKSRWDHSLAHCTHSSSYANAWFLDVVSPGWEALVNDDYSALFPLCWRSKAGIKYLYQPAFTQQGGLYSLTKPDEEQLSLFLETIPKDFRLIEINLNTENVFRIDGFDSSKRVTHHLSLHREWNDLEKSYSDNLKRNLKKAAKAGLTINKEEDADEIINHFKDLQGKKIDTLKERDYEVLKQLIRIHPNFFSINTVKNNAGSLIAGAVFLESTPSYIFLFSSTSDEGRETGAMSLLISDFIKRHAGENKLFDFEGSMNPSLSRFYKSFGSEEVVYLQIRKNNLPRFMRWLK